MESSNKRTTATIIILIVTALLIGGAIILSQQTKPKESARKPAVTKTENPAKKQTDDSPDTPVSSTYKEGSYNATGNYQSPGGSQEIKISISLASDGTISDSSAQPDNKSSDSKFYQGSFISNYKDKVVGKKISEIKLDHVGASSLTSGGFNDALKMIENQAKA